MAKKKAPLPKPKTADKPKSKRRTGGTRFQLRSIDDLRPAPYNPRKITPEAQAGLQTSIHEFGDISGIVFNERTGHLVCGHQRLDALKANFGDALEMVAENGTTFLRAGDKSFAVRIVDWPESPEKLANIAANNPHTAGEFNEQLPDLISQLQGSDLSGLIAPLRIDELLGAGKSDSDGGKAAQLNEDEGFGIVVYCQNEADQEKMFKEFESRGYKTRLLSI